MNLENKVIAITGAGGVLGSEMARGLASAGARILLMGLTTDDLFGLRKDLDDMFGTGTAMEHACNVLEPETMRAGFEKATGAFGSLDGLINAAGGNRAGATIGPESEFFDLDIGDLDAVVRLNLHGTIIPCMEASRFMVSQGSGSIVNISSASASVPLTRVMGYSASKASIDNFTRWLATELAIKHGEGVRVNAIAPGFFIGKQNRRLLLREDGSLTARGKKIIDRTPMGRFGRPEELVGAVKWLLGDESSFVTGTVVHIDGGFGAYSGV